MANFITPSERARDTSTDSETITVKSFFPKWPQSPTKDPKTLFTQHLGAERRAKSPQLR